jgi:gamma-glutamyltranspeptidase/glutathione hydrolase/leukotriene-C4 hydrolase
MFIGRENQSTLGREFLCLQTNKIFFLIGGLAIAVPGELRAYEKAYKEFGGGVPWKDLFQPTIDLCRNGYVLSQSQGEAIKQSKSFILNDPTLRLLFEFFEENKIY